MISIANDFNIDDVIIGGVEEALGIQVPFDMKLRYKSAGDPNATSQKVSLMLKHFFLPNIKFSSQGFSSQGFSSQGYSGDLNNGIKFQKMQF